MPYPKPNESSQDNFGSKAIGNVVGVGAAIVAAPEAYKLTVGPFMRLVEKNYPPEFLFYLDWVWWLLWFPGVFFPARNATIFACSIFAMGGVMRLMREGGFGFLF